MVDTTPLIKFFHDIIDEKGLLKRPVIFGASDITNFKYKRFHSEDLKTKEDTVLAVMASSAIPGLFPVIEFGENQYVDGSTMRNFDVVGGI